MYQHLITMKKNTFLIFTTLLLFNNVTAQVLYDEDFDNLQSGIISNDLTGQTAGQGGWYVKSPADNIKSRIINEAGRGKVIGLGWSKSQSSWDGISISLKNISSLWNKRLPSNNIFKMEYELQIKNINLQSANFLFLGITSDIAGKYLSQTYSQVINKTLVLGGSGTADGFNVPYNYTWVKVEVFHDYNTFKTYYHIPDLNFLLTENFLIKTLPESTIDMIAINLSLQNFTYANALLKIDNLRLSAISTLPVFLNTNSYISKKFTLYPNPVTNIVNIANSDNMFVHKVEMYDLSGKLITTQNFNNKAEIQLNVETLTSGTYLLHIQTNEGIAVKKLVKN